jgi:hypothetical protein
MDRLPEWITSVATAATAVAAAVTGFIAWLALRREAQPLPPVIEISCTWPYKDRTLTLSLVIRNRIYETVTIDSVRVVRPKGMTLNVDIPDGRGGYTSQPTTERERALKWSVGALGTDQSVTQSGDVSYHWLALKPPVDWDGGWIVLEFRISSKALTIRDKRMVIKRQVPTAPKTQTEAKANRPA